MIGSFIKRISPFKSTDSSPTAPKSDRGRSGNVSSSSGQSTKSSSKVKGRYSRGRGDRNQHKQGEKRGKFNNQAGAHQPEGHSQKEAGKHHHKHASKKNNKNAHAYNNKHQSSSKHHSHTPSKKGQDDNWSLDQFAVMPEEGKTRFHDLDLPLPLMHAIADLGFEYCSPIQAKALPYTLNGQDVVGKAQTGTGKTAAFLVGIIDDLLRHPLEQKRYAGEARALIIAPTRELVIQIAEDAKKLCKYTDLQIHTLVGGMDYGKQQRRLHQSFVDILVATPGRLMDFVSSRDVYLDQVEVLVVDEADRMLDMGFIPQVRRIVRSTPRKSHRQTLLFSATFTEDVLHLAEQWTEDPVRIEIEPEKVANSTVTQHVYLASSEEKYTLLYNILQQENVESLIVFSNRRDECRRLHEQLKGHGFSVGILSGDVAQNQRVKTLNGFKEGKLNVLVATDVAGRGIHIDGISHVVNFTLPEEPEDYVHRIGRTGRAGKEGTSISFACEDDAFRLMPIKELVGEDLHCTLPPEHLLAETPEIVRAPSSRSNHNARFNSQRGHSSQRGRPRHYQRRPRQ